MACGVTLLLYQASWSTKNKRGKEYQAKPDNSNCGLPAVNTMALTERKGENFESGKELLQSQKASV